MARRTAFLDALRAAERLTEDDLRAAVERLPEGLRARLAQGPLPRRYACGVCVAFAQFYANATPDLDDPMWVAWVYHEVPKASMAHRDDLYYGEHSNDTYRRCIVTYRAAGWQGTAPEPDA